MAPDGNPNKSALGQVLALAGAVSLLGLVRDVGVWQEDIGLWIDAFRSFSRPVAELLFGWIASLFGWEFPDWLKDYLIVGIVSAGGGLRGNFARGDKDYISSFIGDFLMWPIGLGVSLSFIVFRLSTSTLGRKYRAAYLSAFIYFAIILAVNFGLIISGSPVVL